MIDLIKTKRLKSKPGVTYIQLVCYDILYSNEPIFTIANTHTNLYGFYLVGDDMMYKKKQIDSMKTIDEFVQFGLEDNMYNSLYFPELLNPELKLEWIQSIPLLSSTIIGHYKEVYLDNTGELYKFNYYDLNKDGKKLYNMISTMNPEKEVRILTLIKDIF